MTHHEHDQPLEGKRAVVTVGPLYEEIEALYPLYRLREAGAEVQVAGVEAGRRFRASAGTRSRRRSLRATWRRATWTCW